MASPDVQICAIAGGSGAGKTTLAVKLLDRLGPRGSHLTIDWYYRDLSHLTPAERAVVNFDHPDSLEVELFDPLLGTFYESFSSSDLCFQRLLLSILLCFLQGSDQHVHLKPMAIPHCCNGLFQPRHSLAGRTNMSISS